MSERDYYLGFSNFSGIGPTKFRQLLKHFKTAEASWKASTLELAPVVGQVTAAKFDAFRKEFSIEKYREQLEKEGVSFVTLQDKEYPLLLKKTPKPPIGLYVRGNSVILNLIQDLRYIAVVGTRHTTFYGWEVTELLTRELAAAGFTIVSGLALGVDAVAHKTTVEASGKTIAVLGCGVDCCTPRENQGIYNSILEHDGVIVSELPLGHPPTTGSFPSRNRIIAGLSIATLVTEGAEDSGSLITADYAFSYNRPVFAVPGQITSSMAKGPLKLLQKGAKLVTSAQDILNHLHVQNNKNGLLNKSIQYESKEEEMVGKLLILEPLTFDEIVRKTKIKAQNLGTLLSMMEIKGIVKTEASGKYRINS